jgi:NADPH2:quinone reductase
MPEPAVWVPAPFSWRLLGAHPFASAGSEDKLQFCRDMGAEQVFNYKETPAFSVW